MIKTNNLTSSTIETSKEILAFVKQSHWRMQSIWRNNVKKSSQMSMTIELLQIDINLEQKIKGGLSDQMTWQFLKGLELYFP